MESTTLGVKASTATILHSLLHLLHIMYTNVTHEVLAKVASEG